MAEELLEKIPAEKRWAITAKMLIGFSILRGAKTVMPLLGKEEGVFAPVWGLEKFREIIDRIMIDNAKKFFPWIEKTFNIPVGDALGAAKLVYIGVRLAYGPEFEGEFVEQTPERVIWRQTKCPWLDMYEELIAEPEFRLCHVGCQVWGPEGIKAVNPKITNKRTTALPLGDPYCEFVWEFKEE